MFWWNCPECWNLDRRTATQHSSWVIPVSTLQFHSFILPTSNRGPSIDVKCQGFHYCSVSFQLWRNKQATAVRCPLKANDNKKWQQRENRGSDCQFRLKTSHFTGRALLSRLSHKNKKKTKNKMVVSQMQIFTRTYKHTHAHTHSTVEGPFTLPPIDLALTG